LESAEAAEEVDEAEVPEGLEPAVASAVQVLDYTCTRKAMIDGNFYVVAGSSIHNIFAIRLVRATK